MYFWNYRLQKTWLDKCLKSAVAEYSSSDNMLKGRKDWWNLHGSTFIKFSHHWQNSSWNMSLLFIYEILVLFVKILKYFLRNSKNLAQPIQIWSFEQQKTFSEFDAPFLKSTSIFKYFEKEDDPHTWCISEITEGKRQS